MGGLERQDLKPFSAREVSDLIRPRLAEAYGSPTRHEGTALSPERWLDTLAEAIHSELDCVSDAVDCARFAFVDEVIQGSDALDALNQGGAAEVLRAFCDGWASLPEYDYDTADTFFRALRRQFKEAQGLSGVQVMQPIRAALTGSLEGPCLVVVSVLLGKDRCLERIRAALRT
jgi:glutamyl/glutaminyl-tRNA synthetase